MFGHFPLCVGVANLLPTSPTALHTLAGLHHRRRARRAASPRSRGACSRPGADAGADGAVPTLLVAAALALGAAVSLGLARFSYALLLPPMRADLGWSYLTAGAMNTVNAAGYLVGALLRAALAARASTRARVLLAGSAARRCCSRRTALVPATRRCTCCACSPAWRARPPSSPAACWRAPGAAAPAARRAPRPPAWCSASTTAAPASASSSRRCSCRRSPRGGGACLAGGWIALGVVALLATAGDALRDAHARRRRRRSVGDAACRFRWAPFALRRSPATSCSASATSAT